MQVRILLEAPITALIAQLVEHLICNQGVVGSSPTGGTKIAGLGAYVGKRAAT